MWLNNRIVYSDNGTLSDISVNLNNITEGTETVEVVAAEDAVYVGSTLPYNHRYFDVSTASSNSSVVSVELWDGSAFTAAVDVVDQTSSSGASLAQDGWVSWSLDKGNAWAKGDTEDITGLTSLKIFDLYWAKFNWSADLSASTALALIGFKFSEDQDIGTYYPELITSDVLTSFESGKTSWDEQHFAASEKIHRDLSNLDRIRDRNQIIRWELFKESAVHAVAMIAFRAFGDDYKDNLEQAGKDYFESLNQAINMIDQNSNTRLDLFETFPDFTVVRR